MYQDIVQCGPQQCVCCSSETGTYTARPSPCARASIPQFLDFQVVVIENDMFSSMTWPFDKYWDYVKYKIPRNIIKTRDTLRYFVWDILLLAREMSERYTRSETEYDCEQQRVTPRSARIWLSRGRTCVNSSLLEFEGRVGRDRVEEVKNPSFRYCHHGT